MQLLVAAGREITPSAGSAPGPMVPSRSSSNLDDVNMHVDEEMASQRDNELFSNNDPKPIEPSRSSADLGRASNGKIAGGFKASRAAMCTRRSIMIGMSIVYMYVHGCTCWYHLGSHWANRPSPQSFG